MAGSLQVQTLSTLIRVPFRLFRRILGHGMIFDLHAIRKLDLLARLGVLTYVAVSRMHYVQYAPTKPTLHLDGYVALCRQLIYMI